MRKLIAVGLLLTVAALFLPLQVQFKESRAENPKWVWETVPFRTSCVGCYGGYIDSSFASAVGVAGTTYNTDTTIWISLADWAKPPSNAPQPDSLWAMVVIQVPPGQAATTDSMYLIGELSTGGSWNALGQKIEPMNLGSTQLGLGGTMAAVLLEDAGSNDTYRGFLHIAAVNVGSVGSGVVSYVNIFGAPYLRFRVYRDAIGPIMLRVGHYTWN